MLGLSPSQADKRFHMLACCVLKWPHLEHPGSLSTLELSDLHWRYCSYYTPYLIPVGNWYCLGHLWRVRDYLLRLDHFNSPTERCTCSYMPKATRQEKTRTKQEEPKHTPKRSDMVEFTRQDPPEVITSMTTPPHGYSTTDRVLHPVDLHQKQNKKKRQIHLMIQNQRQATACTCSWRKINAYKYTFTYLYTYTTKVGRLHMTTVEQWLKGSNRNQTKEQA